MKERRFPCRRGGCTGAALSDGSYCGRRCVAIVTRAKQTPERRQAIAAIARKAQRREEVERLLVRVRYFGRTETERILLAWRWGKQAAKSQRYRQRKAS